MAVHQILVETTIVILFAVEQFLFSRLTVSAWIHRRLHSRLQDAVPCQVFSGEEHLLRQERRVQQPISY